MNPEWLAELVCFLGVEETTKWLGSPCADLDHEIPLELIGDGEQELVAAAADALIHA
jgi:hypothetical protein